MNQSLDAVDQTILNILSQLNQKPNHPVIQTEESENIEEDKPVAKRTWAKFAGSWGKRPYPRRVSQRTTNWSSLRGKLSIFN